ncbi:MAG: TIGR03617 family F420-dependent LLM class oxidoreductase [Rhodospirillaceae bacterium]|nr:TIGR03617 family F420-dependent LLM class oxidoreductase [Rhodospirillaceae bacterium]MBT4487294.1 TIGR03617 family F420-dependent LLM class oxidoreductase [Rhodospirillaceae bacterium]MBT5895604.1 TIGR03617 family F420-dependent LLM class oxidoreductase [Rhodospirillaceae bacterium]MBT6427647.1 TIGR03617 family F420-dependent LLM class oxidoreductase [Rhodospirillaceae bacterium]MBT7755879.1 TIGR03617 family F420-dependent LLM class oxidoreductase [Rhodospirillaceae bacterium]
MKIDAQLGSLYPHLAAGMARRMEAMGFDTVWSFEAGHDPFLPLMAAATATERLQIGTNIAVAFGRSPFATAQAAWDLQQASGGRFHLGLGTQVRAHIERRYDMPFEHPAARLTDYIRCLRAIFDNFQNNTKPDYQGPFYRFILSNPAFNPGPIDHPHIPIYVAGVNPRMCRVAGEVADGFHVHPMHSIAYLRDVVRPAVDEGAKMAGKSVDNLDLHASVFAVLGETETERSASAQQIREQIAFYASTPSYRALLAHHGFEDLGKKLSAVMRAGEIDKMAAMVPDELMAEVSISSDFANLGAALKQRYTGLVQRIATYYPIPDSEPVEKWAAMVKSFEAA